MDDDTQYEAYDPDYESENYYDDKSSSTTSHTTRRARPDTSSQDKKQDYIIAMLRTTSPLAKTQVSDVVDEDEDDASSYENDEEVARPNLKQSTKVIRPNDLKQASTTAETPLFNHQEKVSNENSNTSMSSNSNGFIMNNSGAASTFTRFNGFLRFNYGQRVSFFKIAFANCLSLFLCFYLLC